MKKILLLEDDLFLGKIYMVKLKQAGYEVNHLDTGVGAAEVAEKEKPDLIILDLIMPLRDGFQVLEDLKKKTETKGMKVLVLTNLSGPEELKRVKDLGADKVMVKSNVAFSEVMQEIAGMV